MLEEGSAYHDATRLADAGEGDRHVLGIMQRALERMHRRNRASTSSAADGRE